MFTLARHKRARWAGMVMAGVVAAALVTGGVADASAAGGRAPHAAITSGVIYACYSNTTKALAQTTKAAGCKQGFTELSWNAKGPQGATGAPGTGATVTSLASGNPNCATGGASVTDGTGHTAYACTGAVGPAGPAGSSGVQIDAGAVGVVNLGGTFQCGVGNVVGADAGTIKGIGTLVGTAANGEFYCAIAGFSSPAVPVSIVSPDVPDGALLPTTMNVAVPGQTGCPSSTLTENGCIIFSILASVLPPGDNEEFFWEAMETAPSAGTSSGAAKREPPVLRRITATDLRPPHS